MNEGFERAGRPGHRRPTSLVGELVSRDVAQAAGRVSSFAMVLALVGCLGTANMIPKDAGIALEESVHVHAGRGVTFYSLDGARVRVSNILMLPGRRSLRFDVRRRLKDLDEERLEGIYQVGTCRILFDADPGAHYEVLTRVFSEDRYQILLDEPREDGARQIVGLTAHVVNLDTGREFRASADACELRIDCHKIDRFRSRPGSECTF